MQTAIQQHRNPRIGQPLSVTKTPEQIRTMILNAIGEGQNTMYLLIRRTGLENSFITREIEILEKLFISVVPGPPVTSYWLKSRTPKGRIVISEDGAAIEIKPPKMSKAEKAAQIAVAADEHRNLTNESELAEIKQLFEKLQISDSGEGYHAQFPIKLLVEHENNPRGAVDENDSSFEELTASIQAVGIQEPLIITPVKNSLRFRIVIGHRRRLAAISAGLQTVPCIIRAFDSAEIEEDVMLIENIQREDLKPTQEGRAFKRILAKENGDVHVVARRVGLAQSYIQRRIGLLNLDIKIQLMIDRGELNLEAGHILSTLDTETQRKLLPRAQKMKSVDLREVVRQIKVSGGETSVSRKEKLNKRRVTTDEEKFTRSWAIKELENMGAGAWITVRYLKDAFDDVCMDSCLETKDESMCRGCPVPRFIAAITRHKQRSDNA